MTPALKDTVVEGRATPSVLVAFLDELEAKGASHGRKRQIGCALVAFGTLTALVLIALQWIWAVGVVSFIVIALLYYTSTLDPELEDDRRLRTARSLLGALDADAEATLWLELNAYDMAVADESLPEGGGLRSRWAQEWLRLEQGDLTMRAEVHAEQLQDGIRILERHERQRLVAEGPSQKIEHYVEGEGDANTLLRWFEDAIGEIEA